jgi:transposase-like protein
VQRYQCTRCNKTFSESQPLDGVRTEHEKVVQIIKLLWFMEQCREVMRFRRLAVRPEQA